MTTDHSSSSNCFKLVVIYLNVILSIQAICLLMTTGQVDAKVQWKTRPLPFKVVKENENVKLDCEFESAGPSSPAPYFVIWYKDGASQNVLALNDQLANLNASNYEITGKYNLIIKNVSRNDSGMYTCQLFQSSDLVATINLTVLGKLSCRLLPLLPIRRQCSIVVVVVRERALIARA